MSCSLLTSPIANSAEVADTFSTGPTAQTVISVTDDPKVNINDAEETAAEKLLEVNSTIAVEKEIAAHTIGVVFANTESNFLPYVNRLQVPSPA